MADLNENDIIQQYSNVVILYGGKPHKVKRIGKEITLLDLRTQRTKEVEFSLKTFNNPVLRLGFVNMGGTVVNVKRTHARIYLSGISSTNCKINFLNAAYTEDPGYCQDKVSRMECPEFADMMLGHYPKPKAAFEQAKKLRGTVAFDKQFAVDCRGNLYYRDKLVGMHNGIDHYLDKQYKYLSTLLDGTYEKAVRTFR